MTRARLITVSWALLVLHAYLVARVILRPHLELPPHFSTVHLHTLILLALSASHSIWALGPRSTGVLLAVGALISWTLEHVGVATGLVYGAYHYTDKLGPRLGHVPVLIPIAWYMMLYPSLVITRTAVHGGLASTRGLSVGRGLVVAVLASLVMTAWDLPMDPVMVRDGHWIWTEPGPWLGVPLRNYVGWLLTTFLIYCIYGLWERRYGTAPAGAVQGAQLLPAILAYAMMSLTYVLGPVHDPVIALVAAFVMLPPVLFAVARIGGTRPGP